jgi:predicted permease
MTRALYRLLLLAFPVRIRREFGDDMLRMFEQQLRGATPGGAARLWAEAAVDAIGHGAAERFGLTCRHAGAFLRGARRWRWWMHAIRQDLTYALRLLVKQPGVTFIAILTLALGIGANTAIFSAVNAILLRPLPYPDPDRLVMIFEKRLAEGVLDNVVSPADFLDWSKMNGAFDGIAAMIAVNADLTGSGEPIRLAAGGVSPAFFDVLGVQPALGRNFRTEEAIIGQHHVVILSHDLWQRRFGSDASVVGRKILLDAIPHEVVGVLPSTFEFPNTELAIWRPVAFEGGTQAPSRVNHFLSVYARLKPDVTLERARAEMDRVAAQLQQQYPEANRNHGAHVSPLRDELQAPVRDGLLALLGAVAFVLLIACVNVANLMLAKAASRKREMAVRAALGAGRLRLAGQTLTESVLLALCGGAGGVLVAKWGIELLRQLAPQGVPVLGVDRVGLDPRVLAFTLFLSIATGLLFGLLPAWHLASQDVNETLKDGGRALGVRRRLRLALVVSEIALASLLLVGAGLTLRSFQTLLRAEPGFRQQDLLTAFITLPAGRYRDDGKRVATYDEIERRLASLPGVRSVGATSHLPLSGKDSRSGVGIEHREPTPDTPTRAHPRAVTIDYFKTMGIRLVSGRNFAVTDHSESPFVVVINETMARRYWPGVSPVGRRVRLGGNARNWREVVGVVSDVKHWGFDRPVNPEMYLPQKQMVWDGLTFVLATDRDPAALTAAVREQLRAVDTDLPLSNVRTMEQVAAQSVAARRATMLLLAIFGALALVLAAAGIYGVMAQLVALRGPEIGIRMTLGAQPGAVMRLILREGFVQAAIGLSIGLAGGIALMRGFSAVLYQVSPADPITLATVAAILLGTTLLACFVPARRAMRVDPVQALRDS